MNRTRTFFYNSAATAALQLMLMAVGFITPKVMLSAYGSEINGLVSSVAQFVSYFNLVEAGLAGAAVYALYRPIAEDDRDGINGIVSAAKHFYTQSGFIFVALTVCLAAAYPFFVRTELLSHFDVALIVLIQGVSGALEFFTLSKYRVMLTADQKTYVISMATMLHTLVNTAVIVILAYFRVNIVLVRAVATVSVFLRSAVLMIYCRRRYGFLDYRAPRNTAALSRRWDALYLQILGTVQTGTPIVLITLLLRDLRLVSVYTIYYMVIGGINSLLSIFISGLSASFGDVMARGEEGTLRRTYSEFEYFYYLIITVVYAVTFVMILSFVKLYTRGITDTEYVMPVFGFLMVLNGFLFNAKTPQGMLVISAGMYRETRVQTTVQGAIAVVLGIALAFPLGIYGIMAGAVLSNLYRDIDLLFFIPKYVTHTPARRSARRMARMVLCLAALWLAFYGRLPEPTRFIVWAGEAAAVTLISAAFVGAVNFAAERGEMKNVLRRLGRMAGIVK